ncbi:MAG: TIGR03546 family protein [Gammaproteobacteria bacterium]|nr:TIGR03546 family protein [Gammaproteobacteria bacterium]
MLTMLAKLLKILNSEDSPAAVGWAISLAFVFALLPLFSLAKWLVLVAVLLLRVNLSAFLLFSAVFAVLAWLFDPLLNDFGMWLLTLPALKDFWIAVSQSSVGGALALNNTLALAALLLSVLVLLPLYWIGVKLIYWYRSHIKSRIEKWRVVAVIKSSKIYQIYHSLNA